MSLVPLEWNATSLRLIDQRRLPHEIVWQCCDTHEAVVQAIRDMVVRGAPAIGIAAAYGMVLATRQARTATDPWGYLQAARARLAAARPTAVNLVWALQQLDPWLDPVRSGAMPDAVLPALERAAVALQAEDLAANQRMGALGAELMAETGGGAILTHCNAGSLATGGYGTALGVIRAAHARGLLSMVYADETRPWLQGARLTAWELMQDGIPVTLIADGAAAHVMRARQVRWVIVGADRIAANGDVANKIGTFGLAILARHLGVRFMVVAPSSSIDFSLPSGEGIPIEERSGDELRHCGGRPIAAPDLEAFNPVFDVTPATLIEAIVTERGVVRAPTATSMMALRA